MIDIGNLAKITRLGRRDHMMDKRDGLTSKRLGIKKFGVGSSSGKGLNNG